MKDDVANLLEAFITKQKESACGEWRPVRQPVRPDIIASPLRLRRALSPFSRSGSPLRSPSRAASPVRSPGRARTPSRARTPLSDRYSCLTSGLVGCPSSNFPTEGATSFETVLRAFFIGMHWSSDRGSRVATVSDRELEAVLMYAEPVVASRKREFERQKWVRETSASLHNQIVRAFGVGGSSATLRALARQATDEGNEAESRVALDAFLEATKLHEAGIEPKDFGQADLRRLAKIQRVGAHPAPHNEGGPASFLLSAHELVESVGAGGSLTMEELIDHVSFFPPEHRAVFAQIVRIGCARRHSAIYGYWRCGAGDNTPSHWRRRAAAPGKGLSAAKPDLSLTPSRPTAHRPQPHQLPPPRRSGRGMARAADLSPLSMPPLVRGAKPAERLGKCAPLPMSRGGGMRMDGGMVEVWRAVANGPTHPGERAHPGVRHAVGGQVRLHERLVHFIT